MNIYTVNHTTILQCCICYQICFNIASIWKSDVTVQAEGLQLEVIVYLLFSYKHNDTVFMSLRWKHQPGGKSLEVKNKLLFLSCVCSYTHSKGKPKWRYMAHTALNALIWSMASLWCNKIKPMSVWVTNILRSVT